MKFLLLLIVVVVAAWMFTSRSRVRPPSGRGAPGSGHAGPATMVACAHCGLHLPRPDALLDADGRTFCSDAHRLAGPR